MHPFIFESRFIPEKTRVLINLETTNLTTKWSPQIRIDVITLVDPTYAQWDELITGVMVVSPTQAPWVELSADPDSIIQPAVWPSQINHLIMYGQTDHHHNLLRPNSILEAILDEHGPQLRLFLSAPPPSGFECHKNTPTHTVELVVSLYSQFLAINPQSFRHIDRLSLIGPGEVEFKRSECDIAFLSLTDLTVKMHWQSLRSNSHLSYVTFHRCRLNPLPMTQYLSYVHLDGIQFNFNDCEFMWPQRDIPTLQNLAMDQISTIPPGSLAQLWYDHRGKCCYICKKGRFAARKVIVPRDTPKGVRLLKVWCCPECRVHRLPKVIAGMWDES
jgi:hypothetical protein